MRQIIHLDISAFAVAVERVRTPRLAGRPVAVAADAPRARVLSLSDEARRAGLRRGMPVEAAARLCRDVIVIGPDEPLYARAAAAVREILARITPVVEPVGYGRAFLDVTGTGRLWGPPMDLAARLRREIRERLRLPAAAGVAVNKLVSRVASETSGTGGLLEVAPGGEAVFLAPMPVRRLPGVAAPVADELQDLNIRIVRELAALSIGHLTLAFGSLGIVLHERALGIDPTPVRPPERRPGLSFDAVLAGDLVDEAPLCAALSGAVHEAGRALRARSARAGRIGLVIRYADDRAAAGQRRLGEPTASDTVLRDEALALFRRLRKRRVRLRGMTLSCAALVTGPRQMHLFEEGRLRREESLSAALDRLRDRGIRIGQPRGAL